MLGVRRHKHKISSTWHRTICLTILAIDQLAQLVHETAQLLRTPLSEVLNYIIVGLGVVIRPLLYALQQRCCVAMDGRVARNS